MGEPTANRAAIAAMNNAWWCRAVCAAHGDPGAMDAEIWRHPASAPRFYPNAITLTADPGLADAIGEVFSGANIAVGEPWSAKDSFATLDLEPLGFRVLFTAEWLWRDSRDTGQMRSGWAQMTTPGGLLEWETAWNGREPVAGERTFPGALLAAEEVAIWGWRDGPGAPIAAGGIISRSPGAVGLSNTFASGPAEIAGVVEALSALAGRFAPGVPVVGYETADECLPYISAGFERAGPLRVWIKD